MDTSRTLKAPVRGGTSRTVKRLIVGMIVLAFIEAAAQYLNHYFTIGKSIISTDPA